MDMNKIKFGISLCILNIYRFIPRLLTEPLAMSRGTLVAKHCLRLTDQYKLVQAAHI